MDRNTLQECQALGTDLFSLWLEGVCVVGLRTWRLARGGDRAKKEARLMVSEKVAAQRKLASALLAGQHGSDPLTMTRGATEFYLKGVRANRQRLMQG